MNKYFTMMVIRLVCFALMVIVQPYGWYTWLFALGAIFLPYIAVVVANVAAAPASRAEQPSRAIEASAAPSPTPTDPSVTGVIRIQESPPKKDDP